MSTCTHPHSPKIAPPATIPRSPPLRNNWWIDPFNTRSGSPTLSATVIANPKTRIAQINPEHYSHFIEHLGDCVYDGIWVGPSTPVDHTDGIRQFTIDALRDVGPAVMRWPGGCFADQYHWRDGIGDPESRPSTQNIFWGGIEPNRFGTHEFVGFCQKIRATPYICGNVGTGSPQEMMDWLEYCNGNDDSTLVEERRANDALEPMNIKYWGVGNESWGCGGHMQPHEYAALFRNYHTYLSRMDANVQFVAVGHDATWNRDLLRALQRGTAVPNLQALSIHRYFSRDRKAFVYDEAEHLDLVAEAHLLEQDIAQADGTLKNYEDPAHPIGLIIDEWGVWDKEKATPEHGLRQPNCLREAIIAASCLDIFTARADRVTMTNIAQTVNVLQCLIETRGAEAWVTPTYHVYDLYQDHIGHDAIATHVSSPTLDVLDFRQSPVHQLSAAASLSSDGTRATFSVTNRHFSETLGCSLNIHDGNMGDVEGRLLTGTDARAENSPANPTCVTPIPLDVETSDNTVRLDLPPLSVAVVTASVS
ncbi:MAG: alpha-N-arabinofuranosidase [Chloroflexi bacterium]|nr:alpha-N-arabinofuranosidase [Chloroflexota bacterium]HCU72427.1 alpha-N-arabinofuranosidase [Chloroflexota bacterium]